MPEIEKLLPKLTEDVESIIEDVLPDEPETETEDVLPVSEPESEAEIITPTQQEADPMQSLLGGGSAIVPVPGTYSDIEINRLECSGEVYRVWTNGSNQASPDFVIVNPPTEIINSAGQPEEDPLGAIAQAIYGAMR